MEGYQVDDITKQCVAAFQNITGHSNTIRISIGEFVVLILGAVFGFLALLLMVIMPLTVMAATIVVRRKKAK